MRSNSSFAGTPGPTLQTRKDPSLFFAGQICGVEGYVESIATGLLAGVNACRVAQGLEPAVPPRITACGSLVHYIAFSDLRHFQPANISFGLLPPAAEDLKNKVRDRKERHRVQVEQALQAMEQWIDDCGLRTDDCGLRTDDCGLTIAD